MNHDYTEEDELKVFLFILIHLLRCNHGSETNQQILNNEELIFRASLSFSKIFLYKGDSVCIFQAVIRIYDHYRIFSVKNQS